MPRDNDKNNDSRGRHHRKPAGRGRPADARGGEKKFGKRDFAGRGARDKPSYGGRGDRPDRRREEGDGPRRKFSNRPRFDREDRGGGERGNRPFRPRGERNEFDRGDRPPRRERPERRFEDRKFSRGDDDRKPRRDRAERAFENSRFSKDDGQRKPRRDFADRGDRRSRDFEGRDRGEMKPWQKREATLRDDRERPKFNRPRWEKREGDDRPRRERPEGRMDWQEHPRSEGRSFRRDNDRPRREDDGERRPFEKRPAFGGRGAYRERKSDFDKRVPREEPKPKKSGERIAKVLARAGLASRRDAEEMVTQGRVAVNGRIINSPALDVTINDVVTVDGTPLPPRERTRLFLYNKPRGLMTTHADPEGRPTVFDNLPEGLPRLISVGRLDFNTEGLLLLTNDGGLARALELPDTGWLRRYRVRAHGEVTQAQLDALKQGVEVDGVKYGPIDATLERDQGANVWLVFAIREGKNREVRNVMAHLGLEVNRLIRISYGPFQLAELAEGAVEEVKTRVLREQLGEKVAALARADFGLPAQDMAANPDDAPRGKKPFKPAGKSALIADSKGRRVLVRRTGSAEARARNEEEANGYGPPRRPKRGYHGKRDLRPRDE
jgi:23S rRNA pseudouridine2605 synthase